MKILAIRLARLGDVILLLPSLASLKDRFPDSELTLLTGHRCAPIAELCPAIDHVIAVDRVAMRNGPPWRAVREIAALVRRIRGKRFDMVLDFHSFRETNLLTRLSGAPIRIGMKRHNAPYLRFCFNRPPVLEDKGLHVAEMFQLVAAASSPQAAESGLTPNSFRRNILGRLVAEKAKTPTVVLYVDAPVNERVWPPERFAETADFAVEQLGAAIVVVSSNERSELAARVQRASRNPGSLAVLTGLSLPQLAGVIASAQLLVSNDTGPMHIGPVVGVRTLGLFSVGYPEHFRPLGPADRFLRANPIEGVSVRDVTRLMEEMWSTVDRGLPR